MAELGLPTAVADAWWHLIEFRERTGVGAAMVQWIQPALRESPDPLLLARIRAIARRAPDLPNQFMKLLELRNDA